MTRRSRTRGAARLVRSSPAVNAVATGLAIRTARASVRLAAVLELHGLRAGDVRVPLPNGRELVLFSDGGDAFVNRLWWRGWDAYEPDSVRPWFKLAGGAGTVLDVGANIGLFSLLAGLANPSARCFAFEPMPVTRRTLERNIRNNPQARVTCVPLAAGAGAGMVDLYWAPAETNDSMASIHPSQDPRGAELSRCSVRMVALDDWVSAAGLDRIDLIKIDVEHHEPEVLVGMQRILSEHTPDVMIEILDDRTAVAVADAVARVGYRHHLLTPAGPIATEVIAPHPSCLNHLITMRDDRELVALWR